MTASEPKMYKYSEARSSEDATEVIPADYVKQEVEDIEQDETEADTSGEGLAGLFVQVEMEGDEAVPLKQEKIETKVVRKTKPGRFPCDRCEYVASYSGDLTKHKASNTREPSISVL